MELNPKISQAIQALRERTYFSAYPENPKAYSEESHEAGKLAFQQQMSNSFVGLDETGSTGKFGEEVSPYMLVGLGVEYPVFTADYLVEQSQIAQNQWKKVSPLERANILVEMLDKVSERFFELAYATMHTTGQSFVMSFQASGPHANDRALESIALGYEELTRYPQQLDWVKNMGKFDLTIKKNFKPVAKGVGLVIGCSTFPTWNTVPGVFANLIAGNSCIIKPHPKSVLPIAIVVEEMQKVLFAHGLSTKLVQLAADSSANPITKHLAEHSAVKLIDYTGGSDFGRYIESLPGKTVFTEKAGVNSVILDGAADAKAVFGNLAFAASLYSGQMCTAPQNIFVSKDGINTPEGNISFDDVVASLRGALKGLAENPKMGAGTLGAIQNDITRKRVEDALSGTGAISNDAVVENTEFTDARTLAPSIVVVDAADDRWKHECFGPILFVVRTSGKEESLALASHLASTVGAITCSCYSTDVAYMQSVEEVMNEQAFTPVSFNFTGAAFVNQHAAFSDFHVTGGNPSGNATFTDSLYINRRFVWVGNRFA